MEHDVVLSSHGHGGLSLPRDTEHESRDEEHQEALRFALDQLSLMALEKVDHHPTGRKRSVNMTECVPVPSSEHVAEIVGRQGCKIKALRAKTNTYIKTPVRGEEPVFIVTGRREDVEMAKREIVSAAEHFSMIRASRCKAGGPGGGGGGALPGPPHLPGQTTIQVRVPYRVVGLVVGPKGATIKRIQQQTHTYIVTPSREKDPVFEVTGMPENVDRAREEIETHITLRTGTFVDLQGDNDFHTNGTDVSLEGLGALGAGLGSSLWSRASGHHSAPPPPPPSPPPTLPMSVHHSSNRKMSSSAPYHAHNGSVSSDSFSGAARKAGAAESGSPSSPFSTGSSGFSASNIWAPFVNGGAANKTGASSSQQNQNQPLRRNSSGLSGGAITPRLSPTLPQDVGVGPMDHPLARRAQSDPLSTLSWLQSSTAEGGSSGVGLSSVGPGANRDCFVCFESEVTAALVPCGHNLFCMECAGQICQSAEPECPVCHTPTTQCIRIFS
uniref:RNA-binding protein MEX3B-like n=1 Tax=Gouania willdenowi TaxID=441366 RepID=A0A8C5HH39_GOUWI